MSRNYMQKMDDHIISSISKKLFELFVVNPYAIAIQNSNGKYLTKYVQYDASVLKAMLESEGSAGCYQQRLNSGLIKWICLDFDCKDKENPDVSDLNRFVRSNVLDKLDSLCINYLTEFSGRRGIHVWIVFDEVFEKKIGFQIIKKITCGLSLDVVKYGLDEFPATDSTSQNKVGKQVKFPLSKHKMGGRSFFFKNEINLQNVDQEDFWINQNQFLQQYKVNSLKDVCEKFSLSVDQSKQNLRAVKHTISDNYALSAEDVISALTKINVFREIFNRLKLGNPSTQDWFVILGSIGCLDKNGEILKAIFAQSPIYDERTTHKNIMQWKDKYFPATLCYLYKLYNISIEDDINPDHTSIDILANAYGLHIKEIQPKYENENAIISSVQATTSKEINYILINDENIPVSIWNQIKCFSNYEFQTIQRVSETIKNGEKSHITPPEFVKYVRNENAERQRTLVSLGAFDRVLTTHIAIDLAKSLEDYNSESFSYRPAFTTYNDIFLNWYTAWGQYIEKIKSYIEMPFMKDWGVITLDIKHFYDNIDFLSVRSLCEDDLDEMQKNELNFLIDYNEKLMRNINETESRKGVPQGPAYARIISEIFLNKILKKKSFFTTSIEDFRLIRYVDDIIIFYKKNVDGNILFSEIQKLLKSNGLELNEEKSHLYGLISSLSEDEIATILRKDKFNYMYKVSDFTMLLTDKEKNEFFFKQNHTDFQIDDAAFIFSNKTDKKYTRLYYSSHIKEICESQYGRGSVFRKIYTFVLCNEDIFSDFSTKKYFNKIPKKSLNFKNFISTLYFNVQCEQLNMDIFYSFCDSCLSCVEKKDLDEEELEIIEALIDWRNANGYN